MATLWIRSEGNKELTLSIDRISNQTIEKIIDRGFDWIDGKRAFIPKEGKTPIIETQIHMGSGKQTIGNIAHIKKAVDNTLDENISKYVHADRKQTLDEKKDVKPKKNAANGEAINDVIERNRPFPERILVPISIECPSCGFAEKQYKHYGVYFTYCSQCNAKLHVKPMDGQPDEYGVYAHAFEIHTDKVDKPITLADAGGADIDQQSRAGRTADQTA